MVLPVGYPRSLGIIARNCRQKVKVSVYFTVSLSAKDHVSLHIFAQSIQLLRHA